MWLKKYSLYILLPAFISIGLLAMVREIRKGHTLYHEEWAQAGHAAHSPAEFPTVFWRARATNPIGAWYTKLCDGLMRFPAWHVFWRGLAIEQVPAAVAFALAAPVDIAAPDA